jgi:O-antigen biosynthesis protein WbqV
MVLDMGQPVRIVHLAERMIQLAGLRPYVDIDIIFTGLRPGEKLFEELFDPSEVQSEVTDDGYVVASPRVIDKVLLEKTLSELEQAAYNEDEKRAVELLSHIVPEFENGSRVDEGPATDSLVKFSSPHRITARKAAHPPVPTAKED